MSRQAFTLPKGSTAHRHGCPVELMEDTQIYSATIERYGSVEAFEKEWGPQQQTDSSAGALDQDISMDRDGGSAEMES